jgi:ubiquinone/menaquinone biosynthesis C-methylase UbiE
LDEARIAPAMRVLDVACGTGTVARRAAQRVGSDGMVAGVDFNPEMLTAARVLAEQAGLTVEWREAQARALPFADESFDLVTCQQGLQFFPDRGAALAEMARVLRPGGRVALAIWRALSYSPGAARMLDIFEQYVGTEATAGARAPFQLGDATEIRRLLDAAGFDDIRVKIAVRGVRSQSLETEIDQFQYFLGGAWSNLTAQIQAECRANLAAALAGFVDDYGYITPMEVNLVIAEAM